jgi:FkbM family methyltransferase
MVSTVLNYFKPDSVLDIGANIGDFYRESKQVLPEAYYYLIEPNPECQEILSTLEVDFLIGAVSDKVKEATFLISTAQYRCTGNSLYRENTSFFADSNVVTHNLTTTTLDILFASKDTFFDLIKIDTQGSELDIIRGGTAVIEKAKGVILELAVADYNQGAPKGEEVVKVMTELGFVQLDRLGCNFNPETRELVHEDYLFIRKDILNGK